MSSVSSLIFFVFYCLPFIRDPIVLFFILGGEAIIHVPQYIQDVVFTCPQINEHLWPADCFVPSWCVAPGWCDWLAG